MLYEDWCEFLPDLYLFKLDGSYILAPTNF